MINDGMSGILNYDFERVGWINAIKWSYHNPH